MMRNLVCLLEEPSAREMLKAVLPQILPEDVYFRFIVFEGKQDLEKQLEKRLKGWQIPNSNFLVMRDQDSGDCVLIKNGLLKKITNSGKERQTLVRIACRELESFYLGDLEAVEEGLAIANISKFQSKATYRSPDQLVNAAEELHKLTSNKYQKVQGSRGISPHLKLDGSNKSKSFNVLISGLKGLFSIS